MYSNNTGKERRDKVNQEIKVDFYAHLAKGDIFSMLKFNDILLSIDNFKASIRVKPSYVTSIEPAHALLVNLCSTGIRGPQ